MDIPINTESLLFAPLKDNHQMSDSRKEWVHILEWLADNNNDPVVKVILSSSYILTVN
jgi:hypothetical protein